MGEKKVAYGLVARKAGRVICAKIGHQYPRESKFPRCVRCGTREM